MALLGTSESLESCRKEVEPSTLSHLSSPTKKKKETKIYDEAMNRNIRIKVKSIRLSMGSEAREKGRV